MHRQDPFFYRGVRPHIVQKIALVDQRAGAPNQGHEKIVCFRREGNDFAGFHETALADVQRELSEPVDLMAAHAV